MKLLLINSVCGTGSTGRICESIAKEYESDGYDVRIAYGRRSSTEGGNEAERCYGIRIGIDTDIRLHGIATRAYDLHGFASKHATRKFLEWADNYDPDIIWLHNLHGYYINIELLFKWIKERQAKQINAGAPVMKVRWTLHDCWAFTGHCSHFTYVGCDRWKMIRDGESDSNADNHSGNHAACDRGQLGCHHCPQKKEYPTSYGLDHSKQNWLAKQALFTGVREMTIITPSEWLAGLVKQSLLYKYPVEVYHNTVDTTIFKPVPEEQRRENRKKLLARIYSEGLYTDNLSIDKRTIDDQFIDQIEKEKKIILGVSGVWTKSKGYDDFIELSRLLSDTYIIVLVGVIEKQAHELINKSSSDPKPSKPNDGYMRIESKTHGNSNSDHARIFPIIRTEDQKELAEMYTAADWFVNLTYDDNYPTVNLEARACGCRIITYDTGGSPEAAGEGAKVVERGRVKDVVCFV